MRKNLWIKKLISFILCITMIAGMTPDISASAVGTPLVQPTGVDNKIVDTATVDSWKNIFLETTTRNAGAVWVDKSVFESWTDFENDTDENENYDITMNDAENNFLVALSGLASNKTITGYSTIPTDTVFVLDMSSSMEGSDYNYIDDLAVATNNAIKKLLELNKNNRIAVVLYSGAEGQNSNGTLPTRILMPLDTYTAGTNGNFIEYREVRGTISNNTLTLNSSAGSEEGIAVVSGVTNSKGGTAFGLTNNLSRWSSGTFTQDGIYVGANILIGAETKVTGENNPQYGKERMPIMVLMTDGAPSVFSTDFAGTMDGSTTRRLESAHKSSTTSTGAATEFLVQLTAAWAKYKVEEHYGENDMLFYTLGLTTDDEFSTGSLNPANPVPGSASDNGTRYNSNLTNAQFKSLLDEYWNNYLNNRDTTLSNNTVENFRITTSEAIHSELKAAVQNTANNRTNGLNKYRYYVDSYYQSNIDTFGDAFDAIVDEIILQSKYYPTYIQESSSVNHGGQLSLVDTLGEYMEVKDIKNIQLGPDAFRGVNAAIQMSNITSLDNLNEIQENLIEAMIFRMKLTDRNEALKLITAAKASRKLFYNDNIDYNNAIGWYGAYTSNTADIEYKGVWDGKKATTATAPIGANCVIDSYYFYGMGDGAVRVGDMRYIEVEVAKFFDGEFAGQTKVRIRTPASLIPLVEYEVKLDGENLTSDVESITTNIDEGIAPIRLIYEVGLRDDINSLNVGEIVAKDEFGGSYEYITDGKTYTFYTNSWDNKDKKGDDIDIGVTPPRDVGNSYAFFNPSTENEYTYYQYDEEIYVRNGDNYVLYSGSAQPSGNGYYAQRLEYLTPEAGQTTTPQSMFLQIDPSDLAGATHINGQWYIPKGTPTLMNAAKQINYKTVATGGQTQTYKTYSTYYVNSEGHTGGTGIDALNYYMEVALGNNGKFTMNALQGIRLQKIVPPNSGLDANETYTFTIAQVADTGAAITDGNIYKTYLVNAITDDTTNSTEGTVKAANGVLDITLKANQTLYIADLPAGQYTVTEAKGTSYIVSAINDTATSDDSTTVTVANNTFTDTSFTNIARTTGNLTVAKAIEHPFGTNYSIPDDKVFNIQVKLEHSEGILATTYTAKKTGKNDVFDITIGSDGYVKDGDNSYITLKHNQQLEIFDLPQGTVATVVEQTPAAGFTANYWENGVLNGSTVEGQVTINPAERLTSSVMVVNNYDPEDVTNPIIKLTVNKTFTGRKNDTWLQDDTFTFQLQKSVNGIWTDVGSSVTVNSTSDTVDSYKKTVDLSASIQNETYSAIGDYYYRVVENRTNPILGVNYDSTLHGFVVKVTDINMDGRLEFIVERASTTNEAQVTVAKNATDTTRYDVTTNFTNKYEPSSVNTIIEINKAVINSSDSPLATLNGFAFKVTECDSTGAKLESDTPITSAETSATGVTRVTIPYTTVDWGANQTEAVHYYAIEETGNKSNWIFDKTVKNITVRLTHTNNVLNADVYRGLVTSNYDTAEKLTTSLVFKNTYTPTPASLTIPVSKTLTGRDLNNGEFTFKLADAQGITNPVALENLLTVTNSAEAGSDGAHAKFNLSFTKVGTYFYDVTEQIPEDAVNNVKDGITYDNDTYRVTVVVSDNNGALNATYQVLNAAGDTVPFVNSYTPAPVTANVSIDKELVYKDTGIRLPFSEGIFSVGLYAKDDTDFSDPLQVLPFGTANTDNVGTASFELTYNKSDLGTENSKEFGYVLKEILHKNAEGNIVNPYNGVNYDLNPRNIKVTVNYDNSIGELSAIVDYSSDTEAVDNKAQIIKNQYDATETSVVFSGTKTLTDSDFNNNSDKEFTIELYKTDGQFNINSNVLATQNIVVAKSGEIISGGYTFDKSVAGLENELNYTNIGTHYYLIKEKVIDTYKNMIFDTNEYHITVIVTDNGRGQLHSAVSVLNANLNMESSSTYAAVEGKIIATADNIDFINTKHHFEDYKLNIEISKSVLKKGGENLLPKDFTFVLTEVDANGNIIANGVTGTVKSDEYGQAKFAEIEVEENTTRYFTVSETNDSKEHVTYDTKVYTICVAHGGGNVTVTCNPDGELKDNVLTLFFQNEYDYTIPNKTPEPDPTLPDVPKTGDSSMMKLWIAMIVIGTIGFVSTAAYAVRRRRQRQ